MARQNLEFALFAALCEVNLEFRAYGGDCSNNGELLETFANHFRKGL